MTEFVQFRNIVDLFFVQVGQMQLIRRQISNELNCSCKFDSQVLYNALGTFNKWERFCSYIYAMSVFWDFFDYGNIVWKFSNSNLEIFSQVDENVFWSVFPGKNIREKEKAQWYWPSRILNTESKRISSLKMVRWKAEVVNYVRFLPHRLHKFFLVSFFQCSSARCTGSLPGSYSAISQGRKSTHVWTDVISWVGWNS